MLELGVITTAEFAAFWAETREEKVSSNVQTKMQRDEDKVFISRSSRMELARAFRCKAFWPGYCTPIFPIAGTFPQPRQPRCLAELLVGSVRLTESGIVQAQCRAAQRCRPYDVRGTSLCGKASGIA